MSALASAAYLCLFVALLLGLLGWVLPSSSEGGPLRTLFEALEPFRWKLLAFAIVYINGLMVILFRGATVRPEGEEAADYLRVAYFTGTLKQRAAGEQGGLWLSASELCFVTPRRRLALPLSSIREIRVVPERARLLGRLGLMADLPLVITFDDGRRAEVFVFAPRFLAGEILAAREAILERAPRSPNRSGIAAG